MYAPPYVKKLPVIYTAPTEFNVKGYKGSFESWQEYGKWVSDLIEGRDNLDKVYADEDIALTKNISERKNKIKALYEYMQKNTRYFYVGFSIGGNQPIHANEVAKNGLWRLQSFVELHESFIKGCQHRILLHTCQIG